MTEYGSLVKEEFVSLVWDARWETLSVGQISATSLSFCKEYLGVSSNLHSSENVSAADNLVSHNLLFSNFVSAKICSTESNSNHVSVIHSKDTSLR